VLGLALALPACGTSGAAPGAPDAAAADAMEVDVGGDAVPVVSGCRPSAGTTGNPQTIPDLIALVNGLPPPVTLPCLIESLDRPLSLVATTNVVSAQPAESARNPRVFLLTGRLSLTFVPDGPSRDVLELGEISADNTQSIKGEVHFPIEAPLGAGAPFDRLVDAIVDGVPALSKCYACHYPERPLENRPGYEHAFESIAYRPNPLYAAPLDDLRREREVCDATAEPERCATLEAIFGHGAVEGGAFPSEMVTFF
jgi:hypothetical protein